MNLHKLFDGIPLVIPSWAEVTRSVFKKIVMLEFSLFFCSLGILTAIAEIRMVVSDCKLAWILSDCLGAAHNPVSTNWLGIGAISGILNRSFLGLQILVFRAGNNANSVWTWFNEIYSYCKPLGHDDGGRFDNFASCNLSVWNWFVSK